MKSFLSKGISIFMAAAISISSLPVMAMASDTPSDWAVNQVNSAISYGLIPETVQGRYQDNITREEFAELLDEVCNDYSGGKGSFIFWDNYNWNEYNTDGHPFTDTQNFAVKRMYCAGIMSGTGNGKFSPNAPLTREQAATMINNLFTFCSKALPAANAAFADNGDISAWALDSVGKVQAAGIMSGVGNNRFAPKDNYTREQSIVTALKTYEVLLGKTPSTGSGSGTTSTGGNANTAPSANTTSGDFNTTFQKLYDELKYYNDSIEIANATESMPPNTDDFPEIDSSLKNQFAGKELAIGYLEAARKEMVKAVSCWIDIEIYGMMGYTQGTLTSRTRAKREEIQQHVDKANEYLNKAYSAAN